MIVFLNKCDLLKRKLKKGALVKDHLPSFGDRPNDVHSVVKCKCSLALSKMAVFTTPMTDLRDKFKDTLKQNSPEPRVCYLFATSVTVSPFFSLRPPVRYADCICPLIGHEVYCIYSEIRYASKDSHCVRLIDEVTVVRDGILREHLKNADFV